MAAGTTVIPNLNMHRAAWSMGSSHSIGSLHGFAARREPVGRRLAGHLCSLYVLINALSNPFFQTSPSWLIR